MKNSTKKETMGDALGIPNERMDAIKSGLVFATKQFFENDKYSKKTDAMQLAIEHCKPESIEEAVLIGMSLQAALSDFIDPMSLILRMMQE